MSVQIHAYVNSDTVNTKTLQIFNNEDDFLLSTFNRDDKAPVQNFDRIGWSNKRSGVNRILESYSVNTRIGRRIAKNIIRGDIQGALNIIRKNIDELFFDSLLQIKLSGISVPKIRKLASKSKSGKRLKNFIGQFEMLNPEDSSEIIQNVESIDGIIQKIPTRSYVKTDTLLKKYKIFGFVRSVPYTNYLNNVNDKDENCFYYHCKDTYTKISKKVIEKFNKEEGVSLDEVIEFTTKYKIKCILCNFIGRIIYKNNYPQNKNHPTLIAMISNNHFFPSTNAKSGVKPKLNDIKTDHCAEGINDYIVLERNNKIFTQDGYELSNDFNDFEIDNELFKGLRVNFNHKNDVPLVKAFMYSNEKIGNCKYEYDINKAYFNVAFNIIDGEYPIFSFENLWEIYDDNDDIHKLYYYSLKETTIKNLAKYGINSNFRCGFMIKYLLKNYLINKSDIEYFKKPSYVGHWTAVKTRIDALVNKVVRRVLKLDINVEITDEHIKQSKIDKKFVFYNGLLGKYNATIDVKIHGLNEDEYDLLNWGAKEDEEIWTYDGSGNDCTYKKSTRFFKNLNNTTIYNNIVETANLILLKNILFVKKNYGLMPLKVKVDAIGYRKGITLINKYKKYFKLVTMVKNPTNDDDLMIQKKKIFRSYHKMSLTYVDFGDVMDSIKKEVEKVDKNISYFGAPGTGKTYKVLNEHVYDVATTVTNVCCLNISNDKVKAGTIYSKLQLYNPDRWNLAMSKLRNKTIWLDEYSMVNRYIWNFLYLLCSKYNCKMIISGDLNQISPVGESKIDINNIVFKQMMGKNEILKTDYRNDAGIKDIREKILNKSTYELYSIFKKRNSKYDWRKCDRHLTFTNKAADYINNEILLMRDYTFKFFYKKDGSYSHLNVSEGVILSCRSTKKNKNIYKRDMWKVIEMTETGYKLSHLKDGKIVEFEMALMKYFQLGFAMTTHSAQGLTIDQKLCIHEITKMIYFDKELLYTAVTRCTKYKYLELFYKEEYPRIKWIKMPDITDDGEEINYDQGQKVKFLA